ncbi:ACT domain-containing protein [Actinidia rufa]|uniref:ACT domain-containing protein n=1 Tax=Actinidia rufa TaxID=165716 RepID=A0A7J0GVL3_9ERIC|nr:ACT domain-containing protein [Actinidia rufa]
MEESNELGTKAVASVSAIESPSHEVGNNLSHSREEGELSSSDDDELHAGSASDLNISSVAQEETVPVASFNKIGVKEGRRVSTGNPKSFVDIPSGTSAQLNYQKGTEKNRAPFVPFVISFSDDDSGSDSEEIKRSQALEAKGNALVAKLQDLRQQIAIRENELKLKSAQQNKEIVSGSSRDYNTTDSDNDTARKRRATSADFVPREKRDPEKKRLKLSDPHKSQLISNVPSGNSLMEDGGQQRINERIHRDKEIPLGKMHAGAAQQKKQDDTRHLLSGSRSTGVKGCAGADVFGGGSKCDRNTKLVDPSISLKQPERIVNSSAKNFPEGSVSCTHNHPLTQKFLSAAHSSGYCHLLDMEELQDKELEVAQEHRLKCEIEERNALKAYRNAQRALIEANARCSYLYRKRELYSAHFRSLMMENSSLFWSSGRHDCNGTGPNSSNNMSEDHVPQIPTSSYQMQAECSDYNQKGHYSNIQAANGALQIVSDQHVDGQHLASDPCSEPDASTSEPHKNDRITDGVCSPSSDLNELADEDEDEETFPLDYKSVKDLLHTKQRREDTCERLSVVLEEDCMSCELQLAGPECESQQGFSSLSEAVAEELFSSELSNKKACSKALSPNMKKIKTAAIMVDNFMSPAHTLLQIQCVDQKNLVYDILRTAKDCNIQIAYGRISPSLDGRRNMDLFIQKTDGKKIVDPDNQTALCSRLKEEMLHPLRVTIANRGPDTELLVANPAELSGKGRPRVFYDVTFALKMLGICVFSAEIGRHLTSDP